MLELLCWLCGGGQFAANLKNWKCCSGMISWIAAVDFQASSWRTGPHPQHFGTAFTRYTQLLYSNFHTQPIGQQHAAKLSPAQFFDLGQPLRSEIPGQTLADSTMAAASEPSFALLIRLQHWYKKSQGVSTLAVQCCADTCFPADSHGAFECRRHARGSKAMRQAEPISRTMTTPSGLVRGQSAARWQAAVQRLQQQLPATPHSATAPP